ncbi:MAG: hypothetical protein SFU86_25195 [Pirellulaceae bacterium]|nr:hypothetical protein [Pirellulaceae bacterium]
MKRLSWMLYAAVLLVPAISRGAEPEKALEDASYWMTRKLHLSQEVLAGLALKDFDKIVKAAGTMDRLNSIEKFVRGQSPEYKAQLEMFRYANRALIRNADAENLDGATLAFNQLTLSCVNCHKHLREGAK